MNKKHIIEIFGEVGDCASALQITRHAIYQWPESLPLNISDRALGAALRTGRIKQALEAVQKDTELAA